MQAIDWDEYKQYREHSVQEDKLRITIDFIKSYYNKHTVFDIYDMLSEDDIGQMMLAKRDITSAESLENFMFAQ